jgi:hypothetical protein
MADTHVISIDPGKMTGISVTFRHETDEPVLVWSGEVDEVDFAHVVRKWITEFPDIVVVCERFIITPQTAKNSQAPYSLELIGVMKQIIQDTGRDRMDFTFQTPVDAKSMFPNPALKKLEYWHRGGEGHALDAIRHNLLYWVRAGWKPTRLLQ